MTLSTPAAPATAPRIALLLPVAFLLHLAEEWFGGFGAWTLAMLGNGVSDERFVLINASAFVLFAIGTVAALRAPRMAWFAVTLAALLGLNGVLHALATLGFGQYAPGVVTGVLLYLPLGAVVLRRSAPRLSRAAFVRAVGFGVLLHGVVAILAFW